MNSSYWAASWGYFLLHSFFIPLLKFLHLFFFFLFRRTQIQEVGSLLSLYEICLNPI